MVWLWSCVLCFLFSWTSAVFAVQPQLIADCSLLMGGELWATHLLGEAFAYATRFPEEGTETGSFPKQVRRVREAEDFSVDLELMSSDSLKGWTEELRDFSSFPFTSFPRRSVTLVIKSGAALAGIIDLVTRDNSKLFFTFMETVGAGRLKIIIDNGDSQWENIIGVARPLPPGFWAKRRDPATFPPRLLTHPYLWPLPEGPEDLREFLTRGLPASGRVAYLKTLVANIFQTYELDFQTLSPPLLSCATTRFHSRLCYRSMSTPADSV